VHIYIPYKKIYFSKLPLGDNNNILQMFFQKFLTFYILCLNFIVFIMSAAAFMKILEFYIEIAMLQLFSSLVSLFYNYLSINVILHKVHYV
jgi:hypothetical protein